MANYFSNKKDFDKTIHLLTLNKEYEKALTLCKEHKIQISESLIKFSIYLRKIEENNKKKQ